MGADLDLALRLADAADAIALSRFRARDLVVETKPDSTPVTEADLAVETELRTILAVTRAAGPSVLQVRAHDVLPAHLGVIVAAAIRQFGQRLIEGALLTVDEGAARVRILPIIR